MGEVLVSRAEVTKRFGVSRSTLIRMENAGLLHKLRPSGMPFGWVSYKLEEIERVMLKAPKPVYPHHRPRKKLKPKPEPELVATDATPKPTKSWVLIAGKRRRFVYTPSKLEDVKRRATRKK